MLRRITRPDQVNREGIAVPPDMGRNDGRNLMSAALERIGLRKTQVIAKPEVGIEPEADTNQQRDARAPRRQPERDRARVHSSVSLR